MTRNPNIQFMCSKCKKPVFRLGVKVDSVLQRCGKSNKGPQTATEIPQKRTETPVGKAVDYTMVVGGDPTKLVSGERTEIQISNQEKVNYFRKKIDLVDVLLDSNPDTPFDELWTKAERKLNS